MGQRFSEVLAFCTVLSFPCCNWPYCVMTQHKGFLTSFYKEWCNSVYITLFASAMTEYLTMQVFDCSFEKLDSTNFFAFLIFCSSKRILGMAVFYSFGTNGNGTIQNKPWANVVWQHNNPFRLSFRFDCSHALLRVPCIWHKPPIWRPTTDPVATTCTKSESYETFKSF